MVIVDDELIIREGLRSIAWKDYGIELKGLASNGNEALSMIKTFLPEILLTDIRMPGIDGLKLISEAKKVVPNIKAILLTGYQDFEYAYSAIHLGAISYILKPSDPDEIIDAVMKAKALADAEELNRHERAEMKRQTDSTQGTGQNVILSDDISKTSARDEAQSTQDQDDEAALGKGISVDNEIIRKVLNYMETRYMDDISLITASEQVYINPVYLSRLFKKKTGENFVDILTRIRLRKACEMLCDCRFKTYEISDKVGIKDAGYFSQVFKKYFGMTPTEYRDQIMSDKRKKYEDSKRYAHKK